MYRLFVLIALILMLTGCRDKKDAQGYYERGISKAAKENFNQALQDFNKAIEIDTGFVDAYYARAFFVKEKTGDYAGAIQDYTKAIDLKNNDDDTKAYNNRGHAKFMIRDWRGAAVDFQSALRLNPSDPSIYRNRALLFIEIKNWPMVCLDLKEALELDYTRLYDDEVEKLYLKYCNPDGSVK